MPTCLLVCESCDNRQSFFLNEGEVEGLREGNTSSKHCMRCHTMTSWTFLFVDRRTGRDRRGGTDRRDKHS
jgi:hypothetical protein